MRRDGAVLNASGIIISFRPYPPGKAERVMTFANGQKLVRIRQDQMNEVKIGWITLDDGETFSST